MRAVNLLPADLRGAVKAPGPVTPVAEDSGGSGAIFALGALALCVVGLAAYVVTTNDIKQHESDLAALETRHAAVQAETARLKPYADFEAMAAARVATVTDLASQRFDWELALRDLSRALPADVSVTQLAGSVSTANGGGGNTLRTSIDAPAIEISGCTGDQPSVARMMARLRAVNGVTRVSLASSTKSGDDSSTNTASTSAEAGAPVEGCEGRGKSDPADFQVVAFFENDVVAAQDPSAPATPSAAAPGTGTSPSASTPAAAATPEPTAPSTEPADAATNVPTSAEAE
jgi:Tfp pilus assembly protein PilN